MGMETTLQLVFLNAGGGRVTLSIPQPLEGLTAAAVGQVMDEIINADVFLSAGGGLVSKVRAVLVSRQTEELVEF
jgi:hypothetical protein